jgi:squalene-associated FAD-dependent desaturase
VSETRVVVVGGGLAGISAALSCADSGAAVTLVERRGHLGGLTRSFRYGDWWFDNGQHVFLRCCTAYVGFLDRIAADGDVTIQPRLAIPVLSPGQPTGWIRRSPRLPAPLHLTASLARYRSLPVADRLRLGLAAIPLSRLDLADPHLDDTTFGCWLEAHGQRPRSVEALWDLITVPTTNLPASEASLAVAAKVFQTGLLTEASAADIGWSAVPLGRLHGDRAMAALQAAGARIVTGERVTGVNTDGHGFVVRTEHGAVDADAVVVALPHEAVAGILPPAALPHVDRLTALGTSAIVNVHVVYDRRVTDLAMAAAIDSPVQYVFDRTGSAGVEHGQYLAVSLSNADGLLSVRPGELIEVITAALAGLLPGARRARVVDALVTRERAATFRAVPGTARMRPPARTAVPGLALAGAWTDTGWPATMEGAVRSGRAAARAALIATGRTRTLPEEVA